MAKVFVTCAAVDCKWNEDGQCKRSEIFVDNGIQCATFEPEMSAMMPPMGMMGGLPPMVGGGPPSVMPGAGPPLPMGGMEPRQALLQQMTAGPSLPPSIGGIGPRPTAPPGGAAPPPIRF